MDVVLFLCQWPGALVEEVLDEIQTDWHYILRLETISFSLMASVHSN